MAISASNDIFVARSHDLLRSTDNGQSWEQLINTGYDPVTAIAINSSRDIFVARLNLGMSRSTDNGNSWTVINNGLTFQFVHAIFINSLGDIFLAPYYGINDYGSGIFRSTDNGSSWHNITNGFPPFPSSVPFTCFAEDSSGKIFAGTYGAGVFRSSDSGESWASVNNGLASNAVASLTVGTLNEVFAGTYSSGVFRSTDGGDSWSSATEGFTRSRVYGFAVSLGDRMYLASASGVFFSATHGELWAKINNGLRNTGVTELAINSSGQIFAGTSTNGLFRSVDGGITWEDINDGIANIDVEAVAAGPDSDVFAGTYGNGLYHSTDNGSHWAEGNAGLSEPYVLSLAFSQARDILVGVENYFGSGGADIFISTNNGELWDVLFGSNVVSAVGSIAVDSVGTMFAGVCCGGRVLRSTDGGKTWPEVFFSGESPEDIVINRYGYIFFGTNGSGVYRSTTAGESWTQVNNGVTQTGIVSLACDTVGNVYAGSTGGNVFRSSNSGNNWEIISSGLPPGFFVSSLASTPDGYLFAGLSGAGVFRSTQPVAFLKDNQAYKVSSFFLSQNYPNPFNPVTTIRYELPSEVKVCLKVFDILGQEVAILVNNDQKAGRYEVEFRSEGLASGVYFYRIQAGQFTETKKLLLLK